jgi:hypothetical protein
MNKLQKLANVIEKHYEQNNQVLLVDTWEVRTKDGCEYDVYIPEEDTFLFTIQNYNAFRGLDVYFKQYLHDPKVEVVETWDGVRASYTPFYFDGTFTIKTFKGITEQQIKQCVDYFVHEVLEMLIFNIDVKPQNETCYCYAKDSDGNGTCINCGLPIKFLPKVLLKRECLECKWQGMYCVEEDCKYEPKEEK